MKTNSDYTARFVMHTELYMILTGKNAQELSLDDMQRIGDYLNLQNQQETISANKACSLEQTGIFSGGK